MTIKLKLLLFHLLCLTIVNPTLSQTADSVRSTGNIFKRDSVFSFHSPKGYLPSLGYNIKTQALAPFHFNKKEWLITGTAAGITTALFFLDDEIDGWATVQKDKHDWLRKTSPVVTEFGNWNGIMLVGAFGAMSAVFKKEKGVQTTLLATQAMITSGVWVQLIKLMTGRERPKGAYLYSQMPAGQWNGPFSVFEKQGAYDKSIFAYDAFPSGHTAVAFSIATVFASQYSDSKSIPIISYSAASVIGITRMIEHEHWASDVFAGAVIGYFCGKQVTKHFNDTHRRIPGTNLNISENKPLITVIPYNDRIGISVIF
jgi:membrane-associated phospholipid phosphatase